MPRKPKRSRKGGVSRIATKKHLTPGIENQLGAAKSMAEDHLLETAPIGPGQIRWFGTPGREQEEFRQLMQRPLREQLKMAVVGDEKFKGMGPGVVFGLIGYQELDGERCFQRLESLEQQYGGYQRWIEKDQRFKWVSFQEPIEYRTMSLPKYRSVAFQNALEVGLISAEEFRRFLCVVSRVLQREFRKATKYKGAEQGLEVELVLWHLQQGVMHAHLIVRKVDRDGRRLGLVGSSGKLVWNELDMGLIAERRRRAAGFLPIPKVKSSGEIEEGWGLLDRWTRSRIEGDDRSGKSKRARDRGLLETWDMQLNDVLDSLVEGFVARRPALSRLFDTEEQRAKEECRIEYQAIRTSLGLVQRDSQKARLEESVEEIQKLTIEAADQKRQIGDLTRRIEQAEASGKAENDELRSRVANLEGELKAATSRWSEAEARLGSARANPLSLFTNVRARLVAMTDALRRVLTGIQPTTFDLLFLKTAPSNLGGFQLLPAFISEAVIAKKAKTAEREASDLLRLVRIGAFTNFEAATHAVLKQKESKVLTVEEARYFASSGNLKDSIILAARFAEAIRRASTEAHAHSKLWARWAHEAGELLDTALVAGHLPLEGPRTGIRDQVNQKSECSGDKPPSAQHI